MNTILLLVVIFTLQGCKSGRLNDWGFQSFNKPDENPVVRADSSLTFLCPVTGKEVRWQQADVFNPGAIVKDGKIFLLLRCEDNPDAILGGRTSRIGLAWSDDGIHFTKHPEPVLYPDSGIYLKYDYPGGCEDPRVVRTGDGLYVMAYTSWNRETARLSIAFSNDLYHWEKMGPAFAQAYGGRFLDQWSKSGAMVTTLQAGEPVLKKIHGKYWMYWGENFVNLAWSENLYDWTPLVDPSGELIRVIEPREYRFDSQLTECGPPAIQTDRGVVLLYNGKNAETQEADPNLPRGTYSVGMVVFDSLNLEKVLYRSDTSLLKPTLPHEVTGQYKSGTTFAEGLVYYKERWFLYYGTADSFVGVAINDPAGQ